MAALRWVNLIFAIVALLPPAAHVLELPNKLALAATLATIGLVAVARGWLIERDRRMVRPRR